ncbi:MAG: hypothetical protein HOH43_27710 [Candidatus Latescibacteria bacterium]|nr:hypothetical protein [Candidatus Latescibacterota bacterium]
MMIMVSLLIASGCAPPHMNASRDLVSVTVLPAKSPVWTYTITTQNAENLLEVSFVSDSDLSDVDVISIPAEIELKSIHEGNTIKVALRGHRFNGRGFNQNQFRSMRLMLRSNDKNLQNGDIKVQVTDFRGNVTTVEKISGPV